MHRQLFSRCVRIAGFVVASVLFAAPAAFAQTGRIEGLVRDALNDRPLQGARVSVVGTTLWVATGANGTYAIENVPAGVVAVRVTMLGYQPVTVASVEVPAGAAVTTNVTLQQAVINLAEVVVTGLVGETQKAKLATSVAQLSGEDLPVPRTDALSAVQGKVAGAVVTQGSGRPGSAPTVLLRGPTSINAEGRSQEPLYVVDGVILGESVADLDGLDIESIEVVKGAAASSMYGSRAGNGVVQIKTRRGRNIADQEIHFTVRSEAGANQLPGKYDLTMHHHFLMDSTGTKFLDDTGATCDWLQCPNVQFAGQGRTFIGADTVATEWNTYQNQAWPGTTYNQVDRFFEGGNFAQQYVAAEGRSGSTNFHASWSNVREEGVMTGQHGQWRNNFRVNLDQSVGRTFRLGASTFYSRSKQDAREGALFDLTRMPAGVDLLALNQCPPGGCTKPWQEPRILANGDQDPRDVYLNPDPSNGESANPLYTMLNGSDFNFRGRFLASVNARWSPLEWVSVDGNVSYDRLDWNKQTYTFKGYKTINPSPNTNEGNLSRSNSLTQNFNANVDLTVNRRFGDLSSRTQVRYLVEYDDFDSTAATGRRFTVGDVPTIDNTDPNYTTAGSGLRAVRADGYFGITNLEYKERYIFDALLRNDGSSLFGADARRHWYYRFAGAWRVSQDMQIPSVDELKLRAAYGTAGGRPRFEAQYETYSVSGGKVTPQTLGNRNLTPEFSKELEVGTDMLLWGSRVGLTLNYARTVTDNQILLVPLPGFSGFSNQWRNAGTLQSNTWEASLDIQLARTPSLSWSARVLFDRNRQRITKLDVPPFAYGGFGGNGTEVFFAREGEVLGTFYGTKFATSCGDLLGGMGGTIPCADFAVNDDGLLVWVGPGGSLDNPQWGTAGPSFGYQGQNRTLMWGAPMIGWGLDPISGDTTNRLPIGKTTPDFHLGVSTSLSWRKLTLYGLLEWVKGISVYNVPQQWGVFRNLAAIMDQSGKPAAEQKPVGYYGWMYGLTTLTPDSYFVQDGSFAKLREVSLQYRFGRDQLAGVGFLRSFDGISISLIGRNLLTFTNYNGYDPEVGSNGGATGSAALARVDGYQYPNFRSFTAAITVNY
jgi:TonB-linked SusC/RagA family outer membrane protein